MTAVQRRPPAWSQLLTEPAARRIPVEWRPATLWSIKAIHTVLFASIGAAIALFVWDGVRGQPGPRTAYALGVALGETAIYVSNNQVCPLTPLAEELGAESGSVVDIFLPAAVARRIPVISGTALVAGIVLNAVGLVRKDRGRHKAQA